jgi:cold shock CspA family protein
MGDAVMEEKLAAERVLAERVIASGTVRCFSAEEGRGLISADEGDEDLLFRATSVADGSSPALTRGVRVRFEVHEGAQGLEAFAVTPLDAAAVAVEPCSPRAVEGSEPWTPRTRAAHPQPRH